MRFEVYVPVRSDRQSHRWFRRIAHVPACCACPWTCVGVELRRWTDWVHPEFQTPVIVTEPVAEHHVGALRGNGFVEVEPSFPKHAGLYRS